VCHEARENKSQPAAGNIFCTHDRAREQDIEEEERAGGRMRHEGDEELGKGGRGEAVVDQEGLLRLCVGKATNKQQQQQQGKKGLLSQYKKPKEFYFSLLGGALYYYKQAEVFYFNYILFI
jgi:hypothetical protein